MKRRIKKKKMMMMGLLGLMIEYHHLEEFENACYRIYSLYINIKYHIMLVSADVYV